MQRPPQTAKEIIYTFLIGIGIGNFFTILFDVGKIFNWSDFLHRTFYSIILTLLFWQGNKRIVIYINKNNSWEKKSHVVVTKVLISTIIYSLIVILGFYLYIWYFLMHKTSLEGFYDNFKGGFYVCFSITVIWILVVYARYFYKYWKKALIREEQLKQESLILQYESLKNQVNPHFLFNSLNVLTSLIEKDKDASIKYVKQLSDVFRYVLDQNVREIVPIEMELKFIESYNFLQKIRFGENFTVEINIKEKNFRIIPLAIQILIENAVKHNEISTENPLIIRIFDNENYLYVSNNKQLKTNLPESNQIGLKTLSFQYDYLANVKMEVLDADNEFVVKLPKINM